MARLEEDGSFTEPVMYAAGFHRPTGILAVGDTLYVSSRGVITALRDRDGDLVADEAREIVQGLPFGRIEVAGEIEVHQTHGLVLGPDGKIYVSQGSRHDRSSGPHPLDGTIFRMDLDGQNIEVFATGFRNPFDLDFNHRGDLFATDNGPHNDEIYPTAPDEFNWVLEGRNYGYPTIFGTPPPGSDVVSPLLTWFPQIAPSGGFFYDGGPFPNLTQDDYFLVHFHTWTVLRLRVVFNGETYEVTENEAVVRGFGGPATDVVQGPDGWIYIADWAAGKIHRLYYLPAFDVTAPMEVGGASSPGP
ncbi:MAG: PQQ-dependent sugar dehydrogenase [Deinococcus sp.]|nr:PQQ-dependent sugar dehydrogenase [Deinococcus sp.]